MQTPLITLELLANRSVTISSATLLNTPPLKLLHCRNKPIPVLYPNLLRLRFRSPDHRSRATKRCSVLQKRWKANPAAGKDTIEILKGHWSRPLDLQQHRRARNVPGRLISSSVGGRGMNAVGISVRSFADLSPCLARRSESAFLLLCGSLSASPHFKIARWGEI